MALVSCPECNRHIRRNEAKCPFCDADVAAKIATIPQRTLPSRRLSRAALVTFAAVGAGGAAAACSDDNAVHITHYGAPMIVGDSGTGTGGSATGGTGPTGTGGSGGGLLAAYGGAIFTGGVSGTGATGGVSGTGGTGAPPEDAGSPDAADATSTGGHASAMPLYGLPAPKK
jgi:hypothetical protein